MRRSECLNGEWDFMPDFENLPPDDLTQRDQWEEQKINVPSSWRWSIDPAAEFQPYDLFHYHQRWNDALSGILRRTFCPTPLQGERVILVLKGILQKSMIFVNGQKVLESCESYLPLRVDITDAIRPGMDNTLYVWCGTFDGIDTPTGRKVLAPNGSWFAQLARGIWQDVYIEYISEISFENIFIQTSTRKATIQIDVSVHNHTASKDNLSPMRLLARVFQDLTVVKEFELNPMRVQPGVNNSYQLGGDWKDAVEWSPEHPHLYRMQVNLIQNEKLLDQVEVRFGFREVWVEGYQFILNGKRINLRGDAWHYQGFVQQTRAYAENWYRVCRQTGINCIRLHAMPYPEFYLDVADEMGMLLIDESAIYGSSKMTASDHPVFLENCRSHLQLLVLRDRNHPSVIIWSMQNEMRWVDGRDGYKKAMKDLSAAMKALDSTRPISYDGDNRLVDAKEMEIVSMHYNIDGTVASWEKDKPLIFGEHGAFHYVSPQASTALGGPQAYQSYETCMDNIGWNEQLFIEYARKEDVTGITPFNMINYCAWSLPDHAVDLTWPDPSAAGPKPRTIPAHSLTVHNGLIPGNELFRPNLAWQHLQAAFQPVAVFRNEYDSSFYGGRDLQRSFSIYNDTEYTAQAGLSFRLEQEGEHNLAEGQVIFEQAPGMRYEWTHTFKLPSVSRFTHLTLILKLSHAGKEMCETRFIYELYPEIQAGQIQLNGRRAAVIGDDSSCTVITKLTGLVTRLESISVETLVGLDLLIIGKNTAIKSAELQPVLDGFVRKGGAVLVMEQDQFTLGDLSLSDRSFFSTHPTHSTHPALKGLAAENLRFWYPESIHAPGCGQMIRKAFHKPVMGDFNTILECGQGDFGWGGLLWTPLVEYKIGRGRIIFNQLQLIDNIERVPQAACLLKNLLEYLCQDQVKANRSVGLIAGPALQAAGFLRDCGLEIQAVPETPVFASTGLIIVDPANLNAEKASALHRFIQAGGEVLVLPSSPDQESVLQALAGTNLRIEPAPVYQLRAAQHPLLAGISSYDLTQIDKVTYTPDTYHNRIMCKDRLVSSAGEGLLFDVHAPWVEFFIQHHDDEYRKIAMATLNRQAQYDPSVYGMAFQIGKGRLILSQVLVDTGNAKVIRFYTRLMGNLGAVVDSHFLEYFKEEKDFGISDLMALLKEDHQDYSTMLVYFTAPDYLLNNLGEGVFGWMKHLEQQDGVITVPNSAGKICFITVFIESEINRDPILRLNNELPDSSIVPDLFIDIDRPFQCFVNGREFGHLDLRPSKVTKIEDVVLKKGLNRLALVVQAGPGEIHINAWFENKFGDPVAGLKYPLTLD